MRLFPCSLLGLLLSTSLYAANGTTVEDLNAMADKVEATDAEKSNGTKAEDLSVEGGATAAATNAAMDKAAGPADSVPSAADFMRPASDMSGAKSIDIQSQMKKITEPNLFSGAAPNPGTLRNLATGEAPEEYTVLEGDTLYDICDQLIDEADYWPKLWSFNPTIENPHFVYPGMRLRFYAGDDKSPPFLQVITEDDILPVAKGKLSEAELVREDIGGMLMRSELPDITKIINPDELDAMIRVDNMFVTINPGYQADGKMVLIPAFVVDEDMPALGTVIGGSAGSFLADKGQQIILKEEDGLEVGTTYSIVRRGDRVKNSSGQQLGRRYEFIAQLRVMTEDGSKEGVYKGNVVFNRAGVEPGDLVVAYRSVKRSIPNKTIPDGHGAEQEVVDFSEPHTDLGGMGSFVFLDQTEGKLQENKTYKILQNVKVAAGVTLKGSLPDTDSHVAQVYIVDNKGSSAVGYIVHDSFEVRIGDRISR